MEQVIAKIEGTSPYSQSKYNPEPLRKDETHEDWEKRTWRNRIHRMDDGRVFIPPAAFHQALVSAGKYLQMKIPGKNRAQYTNKFRAGVMCNEEVVLDLMYDVVPEEWFFVPANGKPGGPRVWRCFPRIDGWKADLPLWIIDPIITKDVLMTHLEAAGTFVGIGRFRPENGGYYGRFKVADIEWPND